MVLFEIYTKEVEINGDKYLLRPLCGRHIAKLYSVIGKMQGTDEKDIASKLDEETMEKFYDLAYETFKASYPQEDDEKIKAFVSQNLMQLIEHVVNVNVSQVKEK